MRSLCLHIALVLFTTHLSGQIDSLTIDLKDASKALNQLMPVVVTSSYKLYATHDTLKVMSLAKGETYISNNSYYQVIEGVHTFIEDNKVAVIDLDKHTIILDVKEVDIQTLLFNLELDRLASYVEDVKITNEGLSTHYSLILRPYYTYSKVDLVLSSRTKLLSQLVLYYSSSQGLEDNLQQEQTPRLQVDIDYKSLDGKKAFSFTNNPFFTFRGNDCITKKKYKEYTLINNIGDDK